MTIKYEVTELEAGMILNALIFRADRLNALAENPQPATPQTRDGYLENAGKHLMLAAKLALQK